MPAQTAVTALKKHILNAEDYDQIEVDLFGGEPFLAFHTIQSIEAWIASEKFTKPIVVFIDTNGTLVHGEIQEWLMHNKRFIVGLSLDGTPSTHNHNRSGSYEQIDTDFFIKHYPNQAVRATIYDDTVTHLADDIIYLHELGYKVTASFALGTKWTTDCIQNVLSKELRLLIDYYLSKPDVEPCSLFKTNLARLFDESKTKWCGMYTDMVAIDVEGNEYPCQSFQPNTTGAKYDATEINFEVITDWSDPECRTCLIEKICPTCYGINYYQSGSLLCRDKSMCSIRKSIALANSYFMAKRIESGSLKLPVQELLQNIRAIQALQDAYQEI